MFAQARFPDSLSPQELDKCLEEGWFRMGQTIFTTNFLNFRNEFYSAIWLRIYLPGFSGDRTGQRLEKQNAKFRTEIRDFRLTPEKEMLFSIYKTAISFEASPSVYHLIYGRSDSNIYDSKEICIYDGNRLIGYGIFDVGDRSAAGITSFYDPEYRKYSLGRHLIYQKIRYCRDVGYSYFYPGYFVPGYSYFNYKLDIGKPVVEFLELSSGRWRTMRDFHDGLVPLNQMSAGLSDLQNRLARDGISSRILKYEFFEINLMQELGSVVLFDYPLFLIAEHPGFDSFTAVVVYDTRSFRFQVLRCQSLWVSESRVGIDGFFSSHILRAEVELHSSPNAAEVLHFIKNLID